VRTACRERRDREPVECCFEPTSTRSAQEVAAEATRRRLADADAASCRPAVCSRRYRASSDAACGPRTGRCVMDRTPKFGMRRQMPNGVRAACPSGRIEAAQAAPHGDRCERNAGDYPMPRCSIGVARRRRVASAATSERACGSRLEAGIRLVHGSRRSGHAVRTPLAKRLRRDKPDAGRPS